jgi:hypothetical protein
MKKSLCTALFLIWIILNTVGSAQAEIVFQNTGPWIGGMGCEGAGCENGDQVTLAGTARTVTDFTFEYVGWFDPDPNRTVTATVQFYSNNGAGNTPGTLLFKSDPFAVLFGHNDMALSGLSVNVPDTFTWTIQSTLRQTAGQDMLYIMMSDGMTIGASDPSFVWMKDDVELGQGWMKNTELYPGQPENYIASISATATAVPEPSAFMLFGAALLGMLPLKKKIR